MRDHGPALGSGLRWRRLTQEDLALARLANTNASVAATQVADFMFSAAGGTAIDTDHPIERLFRDAHAAAQPAVASQPTYEQWCRVLLHPAPERRPREPRPPLLRGPGWR